FVLEDYEGAHEFMLFKEDYIRFKSYITTDWFVMVHVGLKSWLNKTEQREEYRLSVKKIDLLADLRDKFIKQINLDILLDNLNETIIEDIKTLCQRNK